MIPTEAQLDAVAAYVNDVRRRLFLGNWGIEVLRRLPEDDEAIAEIDSCAGRYVATLAFGPSFWTHKPESQRQTIAHELLHLTHFMVADAVRLGEYKRELGQTTYDHLYAQVKLGLEYMVDQLATIVAELLPLPEIPRADADEDRELAPEAAAA